MRSVDIVVPEAGQEGTESVISAWLKAVGDPVTQHEPLLELSTDKVNIEVSAPVSGKLTQILKKEGDSVSPEDVLGRIQAGVETAEQRPDAQPTKEAPGKGLPSAEVDFGAQDASRMGLSPSVRRLVRRHSLDVPEVEEIAGSGRGGRVTFRDVQSYLDSRDEAASSDEAVESRASGDRLVPHTPMRKRIAEHMVESLLRTAPHVTAVFEADLSAAVAHRKAHRDAFAAKGVRLTFSAYFVAAAVAALRAVPEINSRWHDDGLEILSDFHIGVAAAIPDGLIVPVIRHAQKLDLLELARRLQDLTDRARSGKATRQDLQGGTFTMTNHGVSGSLLATPIISQPQSAILGIGKIEKRLVVENVDGTDAILIKPMCYVTLTIDHRALDGFQANAFLTRFVQALNEWKSA